MNPTLTEMILSKTNYGTNIYAHILRRCYPDDYIVISISGRICMPCRNPFNEGKRTLHIKIERKDSNEAMPSERACHRDTDNAILPGDALSFAALYYNKIGDELLETINKDMNLRIGENFKFYKDIDAERKTADNEPMFSFFKAPVVNTRPFKLITIRDVYNYIIGHYAMERTQILRSITTARERSSYKASRFDYCTFSGSFTMRSDKNLIRHSGLLCIDFDHVKDIETLFSKLLKDEYFETQLLFRSPSGDGLKWVIPIDLQKCDHQQYFKAIEVYIRETYGVQIDKSGKDVSRACFLPYDPKAYINEKYLGV